MYSLEINQLDVEHENSGRITDGFCVSGLVEGIVDPRHRDKGLGGEDYMLGFEHIVLEMLLRHSSIDV